MSGVPNAIAGTAGILLSIPRRSATDTTEAGPTLSMSCAVTVLILLANACFKVIDSPEYFPPEFFGHQASIFPCLPALTQYGTSGRRSQGDIRNWSIAAA